MIEDLVSTGGSSLDAVKVLQNAGCEVVAVLANFQYALAVSEKRFKDAGCDLYTLSEFPTLVRVAKNAGYIDEDDMVTLREWQNSPSEWSAKFTNS